MRGGTREHASVYETSAQPLVHYHPKVHTERSNCKITDESENLVAIVSQSFQFFLFFFFYTQRDINKFKFKFKRNFKHLPRVEIFSKLFDR